MGPVEFFMSVMHQIRKRDLNRLECHAHAITSEGRDDGVGVAEREYSFHWLLMPELKTCHRTEGTITPRALLQGSGKIVVAVAMNVLNQKLLMLGLDTAIIAEEAADIEPAILHFSDAEVAMRPGVHLEFGSDIEIADVRLESNPRPAAGDAARGFDETDFIHAVCQARVRMNGRAKLVGHGL